MAQPSAEGIDLAATLDRALRRASSALNRSAAELGAEVVAVLFQDGPNVELTHFWSRSEGNPSAPAVLPARRDVPAAIGKPSRLGETENQLPLLLRDLICPNSGSVLPFQWQFRRQIVTVAFGFAAPVPPYSRIPESVAESLNLFGLATWSVKEVARLRVELATVNTRLSGRKLVERAKGMLQIERGFSEEEAYEYMRGLSRRRRITLGQLAEEVLGALASTDPPHSKAGSRQPQPDAYSVVAFHPERA
jgi:hypothetical protein